MSSALEEQMLAIAREMIKTRKAHFKRVMGAFELCVAGSPGSPTVPSPEVARLYEEWNAAEKRLIALAANAPPSPIAEDSARVRARPPLWSCHLEIVGSQLACRENR